MADKELAAFVKEALANGASRAEAARVLIEAGWPQGQVEDALGAYADIPFVAPVPKPRPYLSAREAFLYFVLFILLGVVAINTGAAWFQMIDIIVRDPSERAFAGFAENAVRSAVSALVVAAPLFFILTAYLGRARRRSPAMQDSRLRKWLTYLTLVVAASVLIGDLVSVVYRFLGGELSLRFGLKVLAVGVIAGAVFLYYVADAERNDAIGGAGMRTRLLGWTAVAVIVVTIFASFFALRTPATMRAQKHDAQRIGDLSAVAHAVDCAWTSDAALPPSLEALQADLEARAQAGSVRPGCPSSIDTRRDPKTGQPYEYRPLDGANFKLCATFERGRTPDRTRDLDASPLCAGDHCARRLPAPAEPGRKCYTLEAVAQGD